MSSQIEVITTLQNVKNSVICRDQKSGDVFCVHYDSEIIRINNAGFVTDLYTPTRTSSKMAKRVFEFVGNKFESWDQIKSRLDQS